VQSTHGL
jgi:glyoxylase-like metal-dependent hydrolase (beta-lactamase superfamily II)